MVRHAAEQIERLGGRVATMGAFHAKAMEIEDLTARLVFLNRGQGWVVHKLREIMPRIPDDAPTSIWPTSFVRRREHHAREFGDP